jgi:hypothetical protein
MLYCLQLSATCFICSDLRFAAGIVPCRCFSMEKEKMAYRGNRGIKNMNNGGLHHDCHLGVELFWGRDE